MRLMMLAMAVCASVLSFGRDMPINNGVLVNDLDADGHNVRNVAAPILDGDAANKAYVDQHGGGGGGVDTNTVKEIVRPMLDDYIPWANTNHNAVTIGSRASGSTIGEGSLAQGYNVEATDDYTHAEGEEAKATGWSSHAEGWSTRAEGNFSHAEGYSTRAKDWSTHAEGADTVAEGDGTHAEGGSTHAKGYYSHAEGEATLAEGYSNHAEGLETHAKGRAAHAEGFRAEATDDFSFVWQGSEDESDIDTYSSHGNGTFNLNPVGGLSGLWIGETNMADHIRNLAPGGSADPSSVTNIVQPMIGAATNGLRRVDDDNVYAQTFSEWTYTISDPRYVDDYYEIAWFDTWPEDWLIEEPDPGWWLHAVWDDYWRQPSEGLGPAAKDRNATRLEIESWHWNEEIEDLDYYDLTFTRTAGGLAPTGDHYAKDSSVSQQVSFVSQQVSFVSQSATNYTDAAILANEKTESDQRIVRGYYNEEDAWEITTINSWFANEAIVAEMDLEYNIITETYARKDEISATNPAFSNAVLAVGLNIDTNSVAVLNEIAATFGDFPITGTATTVGGLLAALAAAVAWLRKRAAHLDNSGFGDDAFAGELLTKQVANAKVRYALATTSSATMADRTVNLLMMTQSETLTFPTAMTHDGKIYARDFLLRLTYTAGTMELPQGVTKVGDELSFTAGKTYLLAFTEIAANKFYIRAIDITEAQA